MPQVSLNEIMQLHLRFKWFRMLLGYMYALFFHKCSHCKNLQTKHHMFIYFYFCLNCSIVNYILRWRIVVCFCEFCDGFSINNEWRIYFSTGIPWFVERCILLLMPQYNLCLFHLKQVVINGADKLPVRHMIYCVGLWPSAVKVVIKPFLFHTFYVFFFIQ